MKKALSLSTILILAIAMASPIHAKVKSKKIKISADAGAHLYVDGKEVGTTSIQVKITPYATVNVRAEKVGFITTERNYINDGKTQIPATDYIKLEKDDAFENSFVTNLANQDIDIRTNHSEEDAWILLNRIVTGYFDVIAITDRTTGYMATAWTVKSFRSSVIRTRLIIKTGTTNPLVYKAKIVSEWAPPGTPASADEAFRSWDRLLRTFENVIPELQSRLGK